MHAARNRYVCTQCGYIYDPAAGDAFADIPPGTAFEDLPEGWRCPMCYRPTDVFVPLD